MNFLSVLLTGTLLASSLAANAFGMFNDQPEREQTTVQAINQMKAIEIALGQTKGGIVTNFKIGDDSELKTYEVNILKQHEEVAVEIDVETGKVLDFFQS